jgi:hypothetical protein
VQGRRSSAGSSTAVAAAAGGSGSTSNSAATSSSSDNRRSLKRPRPDDSSDGFISSRYWPAGASLADVIRSQCAAELAQLLSAAAVDTAAMDIRTSNTTAGTSAGTPSDSPTAVAAAADKRRRALDSRATVTTATTASAMYARPASFLFGGIDSPLPTPFKQLGARNGGRTGAVGRGTVLPGLVITPGRHVSSSNANASNGSNSQYWTGRTPPPSTAGSSCVSVSGQQQQLLHKCSAVDELRQQLFTCLAELDRSSTSDRSSYSSSSSAAGPLDLADVLVCYLEQLGGAAEVMTARCSSIMCCYSLSFTLHGTLSDASMHCIGLPQ